MGSRIRAGGSVTLGSHCRAVRRASLCYCGQWKPCDRTACRCAVLGRNSESAGSPMGADWNASRKVMEMKRNPRVTPSHNKGDRLTECLHVSGCRLTQQGSGNQSFTHYKEVGFSVPSPLLCKKEHVRNHMNQLCKS